MGDRGEGVSFRRRGASFILVQVVAGRGGGKDPAPAGGDSPACSVMSAILPGRVAFVETCAVFAWVVGFYPSMIWWGQPSAFVLLELLDVLIGWGLAGLVLAWLVPGRES